MTVSELNALLKRGAPPQVSLFFGEETFLRDTYAARLTALFEGPLDELNLFRFDGPDYAIADVENAVESLPVMADRKLLIFTGSGLFRLDARSGGARQEYRDYWEKRLADLPDYCYLLFVEDSVDKRGKLYQTVSKSHVACTFNYLTGSERNAWTVQLFGTLGKKISAFDVSYLLSLCDDSMHAVKREAEKLAAYTAGRVEIARADIDAVVVPSVKSRAFEMVDAIFAHDADKALRLLNDMFELREQELRILGAVNYQLERLVAVKLLLDGGADRGTVVSRLKLSPYAANQYLKLAKSLSLSSIRSMLDRSAATDQFLKDHSIDNRTLLELFVMESCSVR